MGISSCSRLFACLTALALSLATPGWAQDDEGTALTPAQARAVAGQLLRDGQPGLSQKIAIRLVQADSEDIEALLILARAEYQLGAPARSAFAARKAYRLADTPDERFASALVVSKALAAQENYALSQWWLRRAGQVTDNPRYEQAAKNQFRQVEARNPWSAKLRFSVQPSSNINGGPTTNTYQLGNYVFVDPTAVPLSGVEYGTNLSIKRTFGQRKRGAPLFHLGLELDDTRFTLSNDAKAAVTTARAEDFTLSRLTAGAGVTLPDAKGAAATRAELTLGRTWRGGKPLAETVGLELNRDHRLPTGARLGYGIGYERQERLDRPIRSADIVRGQAYWAQRIEGAGQVSFSLAVSDTTSQSGEIAADAVTLAMRFVPEGKIAGATPSLQLSHGARFYDRAVYGADKRQDRSTVLSGELFFQQLDYMGFAPTLSVTYSRNHSNISFFDYEEYGVGFGIRSTF